MAKMRLKDAAWIVDHPDVSFHFTKPKCDKRTMALETAKNQKTQLVPNTQKGQDQSGNAKGPKEENKIQKIANLSPRGTVGSPWTLVVLAPSQK